MSVVIKIKPDEVGCHTVFGRLEKGNFMGEGWAIVPQHLEHIAWNALGFCDFELTNNVITSISENTKALEAYKASLPPPPEPMTTNELILDKLTELEYRQDLIALGLEGGVV